MVAVERKLLQEKTAHSAPAPVSPTAEQAVFENSESSPSRGSCPASDSGLSTKSAAAAAAGPDPIIVVSGILRLLGLRQQSALREPVALLQQQIADIREEATATREVWEESATLEEYDEPAPALPLTLFHLLGAVVHPAASGRKPIALLRLLVATLRQESQELVDAFRALFPPDAEQGTVDGNLFVDEPRYDFCSSMRKWGQQIQRQSLEKSLYLLKTPFTHRTAEIITRFIYEYVCDMLAPVCDLLAEPYSSSSSQTILDRLFDLLSLEYVKADTKILDLIVKFISSVSLLTLSKSVDERQLGTAPPGDNFPRSVPSALLQNPELKLPEVGEAAIATLCALLTGDRWGDARLGSRVEQLLLFLCHRKSHWRLVMKALERHCSPLVAGNVSYQYFPQV